MKTRFNHLTLILSLSIFSLVLFSCEKENIIPNIGPTVVTETEDTNDKGAPNFDIDHNSKEAPDFNHTYSEVMLNTDFDRGIKQEVLIAAFVCYASGSSLVVYSENQPSFDFYNSNRFIIRWYKNGDFISSAPRLECVCEGNYGVVVINRRTGEGIGKARYIVRQTCGVIGGTLN